MSQIKFKNHIQSGDVHGQHQESATMKITRFDSSLLVQSTLHVRCHGVHYLGQHHHRQKHKLSNAIKSIIILHLLQQLASFYHFNYNEQDTEIRLSSTPLFETFLLFAKAQENLASGGAGRQLERVRETERIDNLLRTQNNAAEGIGAHEEQPLDFIKYSTRQHGQPIIDETNQRHKHYHKNHCSHNSHQRHKHRYTGTTSRPDIDIDVKEEPTHRHRERNKRHNDIPAFIGGGAADRPIVATKKGLVKGITQRIFTGKFVDAFLGIPFAQPPIGKYRFRHPQPNNPWAGELDASRMSNSCYQVNDTFFGATFGGTSIWNANTPLDEDCLHLNIWTPFGAANATIASAQKIGYKRASLGSGFNSASKRPVLVWIFGGGFYSGTPTLTLYEGGVLASEEDIVVVSINYRISALGFLYFARPDAPGNAGLFDQLLALQWINDNIDQFGGDPARVTIFGESAGAVSVAFHLLSPLSRNLFSQAILQSGAATCPWGYMEARDLIANGLQLASSLNCPSNQSDLDAVIECLRRADPMALVSQEVGHTSSILNFPFVPVVDGSFLLESPIESLSKSNFKPARILLGSNNDEGGSWLVYMSEFSHCPSSNSGDQNNTDQVAQAPISTHSPPNKTPNMARTDPPEFHNDSNNPNEELDSLELIKSEQHQVAATYLHQTLTSSQIEAEPIHLQQSKNHTLQRSAAANQKQQQLEYLQNESKPCKPIENLSLNRDEFLRVLREDINPYAEHPIGKKAIVFEYSNWNNPHDPVSNYDGLDKIVGDYYFTCHVNEFALRYAQAGNAVYMYHFKQRSSLSPWPKWMGVIHGDEVNFVFGEPLNQAYNYTPKEVELSKRMMKYWANFARYGNPIVKTAENLSTQKENWPEYADRRQYFELHSEYIRVGRGPRSKQCAFWSHYLPQLIQSFDKNNQCQITGELSRIHPFPTTSLQFGHLRNSPYKQENHSLLATIPSFLLFSLIVILILSTLVGAFAIVSKRNSWKFNLWPINRGGGSTSSSPDNEDDGGRHNNSSNA
uniref:Acetylcholinesterase n=1 Tax=Aceria tosichella TaxID=561515 RepID=A0A6G1SKY2_9ACAR